MSVMLSTTARAAYNRVAHVPGAGTKCVAHPFSLTRYYASIMLFVLALAFMWAGELCAAAAIACTIGTVAVTFATIRGNGHVVD